MVDKSILPPFPGEPRGCEIGEPVKAGLEVSDSDDSILLSVTGRLVGRLGLD